MDYTIQQLAKLAGVSSRTLRYYDQIGLLAPKRLSANGYRIYGTKEVDRLQQILFFRELGIKLEEIKDLLAQNHDELTLLQQHRRQLSQQKMHLEQLLKLVDETIAAKKGQKIMTDQEKFQAFKQELVTKNEEQYGEEIREKYGEASVNQANAQMLNMTKEQYAHFEALSQKIGQLLRNAEQLVIPSTEAESLFQTHKEWLNMSWGRYDAAAHKGLADMYLADERFTAYYDKNQVGATQKLVAAIHYYA